MRSRPGGAMTRSTIIPLPTAWRRARLLWILVHPLRIFPWDRRRCSWGGSIQALEEMREAVRINPSHAAAHAIMAHLLCYVGRPDDALKSVNNALRLSPYDPRLG